MLNIDRGNRTRSLLSFAGSGGDTIGSCVGPAACVGDTSAACNCIPGSRTCRLRKSGMIPAVVYGAGKPKTTKMVGRQLARLQRGARDQRGKSTCRCRSNGPQRFIELPSSYDSCQL